MAVVLNIAFQNGAFQGNAYQLFGSTTNDGKSGVNRLWLAKMQEEALKKWNPKPEEKKVEEPTPVAEETKVIKKVVKPRKKAVVKAEEPAKVVQFTPRQQEIPETPPVRELVSPIVDQIMTLYADFNDAYLVRKRQREQDDEDVMLLLMAA